MPPSPSKTMASTSSSFDKDASEGSSSRMPGSKSSLIASSLSQPSVTDISQVNAGSRDVGSFEYDGSFRTSVSRPPVALRGSIATHKRESSTSSEESDDGVWNEGQKRDDPVGDHITKLLNEGRIPHFGYSPSLQGHSAVSHVEEGLQLYPLFSARNYRALRRYLASLWNRESGRAMNTQRETHSLRFFLESFAACYVLIYATNDLVLRSLAEFAWFSVIGTISTLLFDMEEVKHITWSLISSTTPTASLRWIERFTAVVWEILGIIEREILWGHHFQGRTLLWSDTGRLGKFRRKHRRVLEFNKERRQLRKEMKKSKTERKRRERKGETFTPLEMDEMEKEMNAHEQLEVAFKNFTLKPPTFFSDKPINLPDAGSSGQADATKRHLESLQYCQKLIFNEKREQEEFKPVEIRTISHSHSNSGANIRPRTSSAVSPREAIEVVDQFPDIGSDLNVAKLPLSDHSVSTTFSDGSVSMNYDESDYSSGEDDDSVSMGSYASESTISGMPWLEVGAKIGHKLLNARKFRRVITNPESAQKLIPEEAKKLIDEMKNEASPDSLSISTKANSWDGPATNGDLSPTSADLSQSKSIDMDMKKPVHGMWTSAGSAAAASSPYRAVTSTPSPPKSKSLLVQNSTSLDTLESAPSINSTPSRTQFNGLRSPPPSPQIELRSNNQSASQPGLDALGYSTPTKIVQISAPNSKEVADSIITPQRSNLSRKLVSVSEADDPPAPVTRLSPIEKGVKMVVPMFPPSGQSSGAISGSCFYQMGTVMSSQRIYIRPKDELTRHRKKRTNCLSIKVILDKALLRGSKFVEMNLRLMDDWNYVPRHSKFPIGSCVATTFGVGVLVGWRVEDDMHIIRSLWNRSGPGSGLAYLRRDSLHSVLEAAVGFDVQTTYGAGKVVAYTRGGKKNTTGKYFVHLHGRQKGRAMEFNRCQILSCQGATFVPVTEHIRAAALYRLEVLHYKAKLREQRLNNPLKSGVRDKGTWRNFSEYVDLFANSFSKAIAEDPDFDKEFDKFVSHIISLLDGSNNGSDDNTLSTDSSTTDDSTSVSLPPPALEDDDANSAAPSVGWGMNINDMFACFFTGAKENAEDAKSVQEDESITSQALAFEEAHESAEILIRVLLRTVKVARASVPDRPKLHIALAMIHEGLLFIRQIFRVQKTNTSRKLVETWFRVLDEISSTFGPLKERMTALGVQIAKRFKKHGSIAKRRILRFVDIMLGDTQLLQSLELGDWKKAVSRIETAIVKANITDVETCNQLHKGAVMMYKNLAPRKKDRKSKAAAARNSQKMVNFAKVMKVVAAPGRSLMRLLTFDDVLTLFDRVLVRVFEKDPVCSMVINVYAFNFDSIRHLRILNNMSIAAKLWETVLDAIDEELTFATSEIPEQTKYFVEPFVKLFSLGVSQFHIIQSGGSNADWLDFLMEDEAVEIIQELDYKLIDSLEALCNDVKQVIQVLPYIKTIDHDILNLMDEFNFDLFLKEITDVIGDAEKSVAYITERSAILVERFLDYLPRMSIPIERRELQDGWVLTCRSKDRGDLRLSDLSVLRENLFLSVLGNDNVFHTNGGKGYIGSPKASPRNQSLAGANSDLAEEEEGREEAVLDEVRELILSAKKHRAWIAGVGGLNEPNHYNGVPSQLAGLPLSDQLETQLDLWLTSSISDFELLETAIREVSHQIQLQKEREESGIEPPQPTSPSPPRFDPKSDPTVLSLDIKNLTLRLEEFSFRVEKGEPLTIFDPVFEGVASIIVKNVSLTLKVEVKKERVYREGLETPRPVLQLAEFEVGLEKLKLEFQETGADWILNGVLKGFSHQITEIVEDNLKEQIEAQVNIMLEQVNGFVDANPELLLNALGIGMKDLDESIVCV